MKKIPHSVEVHLKSEVFNNFRCKMACDSLDIDINKKSEHHLKVDGIKIPEGWNIGVIYGASGSGKTTLAKHLFGDDIFTSTMDENEAVINQLPESYTYKECADVLNGIGLTSVPCWVRPVKTLSNGQKARAEAAILMTHAEGIAVIDEWTSVVDRTVAKAMSHCVQKFARRNTKQIILLTCHYDIIEWVKPDWVIDCNKQEFGLPQSEEFFFSKRDELRFEIKPVDKSTWRMFSKYHYLSERLPGGRIYCFGLFLGKEQIGFNCFASYVPGKPNIYHFNRTVIHPDYCGLGLGIRMINATSQYMKEKYNYRIMGKFSSTPVYKALIKDKSWRHIETKRVMGSMQMGDISSKNGRKKTLRDGGIKTYSFEFKGLHKTP